MNGVIWTVERITTLKAMQAQRCSASEISRELSNGVYVSRSAVIGKLHRLGLGLLSYTKRGNRAKVQKVKIKPLYRPVAERVVTATLVPLEIPTRADEPAPLNISLFDLKFHHCRWPFGDREVFYCGHTIAVGSYCQHHAQRAVK